jgi:hypothetical protein
MDGDWGVKFGHIQKHGTIQALSHDAQQVADDEPPPLRSARSQTEIWMRRLRPGFTLSGGRIPLSFGMRH